MAKATRKQTHTQLATVGAKHGHMTQAALATFRTWLLGFLP